MFLCSRHRTLALCLLPTLLFVAADSQAQTVESIRATPSAQATALEQAPVIDGEVLTDPAWQYAVPTSGFTQVRPVAGAPASQRTEVWIGYTTDTLYIGVMAYDDNPEQIIVTDSRRDSDLVDTDSFQVVIDGLLDRQNGFVFGTNPAGIEYDAQVINEGGNAGSGGFGGNGFNLNWDTTWEVEARISELGWSAEMAIPFTALRFRSGDNQTWGFNFQRNIRRNNEESYWAPLGQNFTLTRISEAGYIQGIEVPDQRNLQLTPYVLGVAERGGDRVPGTHMREEFGVDAKWGVTSSLTLDLTYNTDFAQVEVDDIQVNLDRFSLFFPEKRPFFLENAGQFAVGNPREAELFFSRRIGITGGAQIPIEGGGRLTGKITGNTNIGLLRMRTEGVDGVAPQNDFSVVRVNQELGNRSTLGVMYVERDGDGSVNNDPSSDINRTYAIDGRWGIGDYQLVTGWASRTDTPGIDGDDTAGGVRWAYNDARWALNAGYSEVGDNFNPEVGFLSRRGFRKYEAGWRYHFRPNDWGSLLELRPHMSYRGYWDFDDFQETGYLHVDNHWEFQSGMEIHTGVNFTQEGVKEPFEIVRGVTVPVGEYEHTESQLVYWSNQSSPFSVNIQTRIGGFFGGDRVNVDTTLRYRVGEKFTSEFSWNHSDIDLPVPGGEFNVDLARLRTTYSFTPRMSLQALVQYNKRDDVISTNLRFAWLQSANAGLFLVYNEVDEDNFLMPRDNARQFAIKYSRILDIFN